MSKKLVVGLVAGAVTVGGVAIATCINKGKQRKSKLEEVKEIYSSDEEFVPIEKMTKTRYTIKKVLDVLVPDKVLPDKKRSNNFIEIYSYDGKEVFSYIYITDELFVSGITTSVSAVISSCMKIDTGFELDDIAYSKYAKYYYAYLNIGYNVKVKESENWVDDFLEKCK